MATGNSNTWLSVMNHRSGSVTVAPGNLWSTLPLTAPKSQAETTSTILNMLPISVTKMKRLNRSSTRSPFLTNQMLLELRWAWHQVCTVRSLVSNLTIMPKTKTLFSILHVQMAAWNLMPQTTHFPPLPKTAIMGCTRCMFMELLTNLTK